MSITFALLLCTHMFALLLYGEEDQGLELRTTSKTEATKIFLRAG